MAEPTYVYKGRIERGAGAIRTAHLPAETAPVYFGVHGAIAQHYGSRLAGKGWKEDRVELRGRAANCLSDLALV